MDIDEETLGKRFVDTLRSPAARTETLARQGRTFSADWIVRIGGTAHLIRTEAGRVTGCEPGLPLLRSTRLSVNGTPRAWHELWKPMPRAGWHDVFALYKRGEMQFEGDIQLFLAHLQYLKDVLNLPRKETC